jgi:hypothetical protein
MNGTTVVGLAIKYENHMWRPHSTEDEVLSEKWFCTAASVRKWFEDRGKAAEATPLNRKRAGKVRP